MTQCAYKIKSVSTPIHRASTLVHASTTTAMSSATRFYCTQFSFVWRSLISDAQFPNMRSTTFSALRTSARLLDIANCSSCCKCCNSCLAIVIDRCLSSSVIARAYVSSACTNFSEQVCTCVAASTVSHMSCHNVYASPRSTSSSVLSSELYSSSKRSRNMCRSSTKSKNDVNCARRRCSLRSCIRRRRVLDINVSVDNRRLRRMRCK